MSSPRSAAPVPELEDELAAFRAQWQAEAQRRNQPLTASPSLPSTSAAPRPASPPTSPKQGRKSLDAEEDLGERLSGLHLEEKEREQPAVLSERERSLARQRPKSALEHYRAAVEYEKEGQLQDALVNYRSAFRLDPDVDRAYHLESVALDRKRAARGPDSHAPSSSTASDFFQRTQQPSGEFKFERTLQLTPDYDAKKEHRSREEAERESGSGDKDSTHPSSTTFLLNSLLKSIAENPYERPPPAVSAAPAPSSDTSPSSATVPLPPPVSLSLKPPTALTAEQVLASLAFIPADEEKPLPLAHLPHEVLLLILHHLSLSSILPPPKAINTEPEPQPFPHKGKRAVKKKTLKEEMQLLEMELELEDHQERAWQMDVEALERFALSCRAARVLTLDTALWRALCFRTYVPPHQISRGESSAQLVTQHGNDWRRFFIEHPRLRFDGAYISVVTYLRRGETESRYAPTHLVTFYRYCRFYHNGLVLSLLTTDPPNTVVRRLNPTLRMKGLTIGRWRLKGELVELSDLQDPAVKEQDRKYSFKMEFKLKSTMRGKQNKLEMISLATENLRTLEVEPLALRPVKPFFFSRVAAYAGEDKTDVAA
ncbi:hypothetical protein JCM8547_007082 [Rhodosporidiobolus lusitaniae]